MKITRISSNCKRVESIEIGKQFRTTARVQCASNSEFVIAEFDEYFFLWIHLTLVDQQRVVMVILNRIDNEKNNSQKMGYQRRWNVISKINESRTKENEKKSKRVEIKFSQETRPERCDDVLANGQTKGRTMQDDTARIDHDRRHRQMLAVSVVGNVNSFFAHRRRPDESVDVVSQSIINNRNKIFKNCSLFFFPSPLFLKPMIFGRFDSVVFVLCFRLFHFSFELIWESVCLEILVAGIFKEMADPKHRQKFKWLEKTDFFSLLFFVTTWNSVSAVDYITKICCFSFFFFVVRFALYLCRAVSLALFELNGEIETQNVRI